MLSSSTASSNPTRRNVSDSLWRKHSIRTLQTRTRRAMWAFLRRGPVDEHTNQDVDASDHGDGLSLDTTLFFAADDRPGLERLLRHHDCPSFSTDGLEEPDPQRLIYHQAKPGRDKSTEIPLSPLPVNRAGRRAAPAARETAATVTRRTCTQPPAK